MFDRIVFWGKQFATKYAKFNMVTSWIKGGQLDFDHKLDKG